MKKYIIIFFAAVSTLLLSGCWNYREVNRLAIVGGVAIDKDSSSDEYTLTIEIMNPEAGQAGGGRIKSEVYEVKGNTIFDAVRDFVLKLGRKAYWAHAKVLIVDKDIAEKDIPAVLDFFYRDSELRRDINVLISEEDTAGELLKTNPDLDDTRAFHIFSIIHGQKATYKYPQTELWKVVESISHKEKAILIPLAKVDKEKENVVEIRGSAIFKDEKVIGYIDDEDTRNVLWINGELKKGIFPIKNIKDDNDITFEIFKSKSKTKVAFEEETVKIKTLIKSEVSIAELSGGLDFREKEIRLDLERLGEEAIRKSLNATVKKLQQQYKSDVFEFHSAADIENSKLWRKIKPRWGEEFSSASVEIEVDMHIRGSAVASKPIKGE